MALFLKKINDFGFETEYHRVSDVTLNNSKLFCLLESYVSKEYRQLEKPADRNHFYFEITVEEEESMGIRQLCYKKIKELPEWAEATDC